MLVLHSVVACLAMTGAGQTELLDFTAEWCGPCRQMAPIVDSLAAQGAPIRKVNLDQERALAARYNVTAIPCFVMIVDGQEVDRVVGGATRSRLEQMLSLAKRGSTAGAVAGNMPGHIPALPGRPTTFAGGAMPDAALPATNTSPPAQMPTTFAPGAAEPSSHPLPSEFSQEPLVTSAPTFAQGPHRQALAEASTALAKNTQAAERCLASSVRLRIEDPDGNSVGSGTIIDARAGEALVLTCGHIFRDSKGQGRITVDLFGPGAPKKVAGQLIGYDLKRDVGLVSFRPGVPVQVAQLAIPSHIVRTGDAVISIGCDNGREPSVRTSRVTSTDKYLPPPNIQVAGQPVEGRSGGGLFTADGLLIGVCNAADPADNEGLYAGIGSIHNEIARKGLTELVATTTPASAPLASDPTSMARTMPIADMQSVAPRVVPTSSQDPTAPRGLPGNQAITPAERSLLEKIRSSSADAEVICIVRPLADAHSMSEIVVVDRASQDLLRQLSAEGHAQAPDRMSAVTKRPVTPQPREALLTSENYQSSGGAKRFK